MEHFAEDIDRHPKGLPVRARAATLRYRASKFVQRHRAATAAAALILISSHYWVALAKSAPGQCLTVQNRYVEAEPLLIESHQKLTDSQGVNNPRTKPAKQRLDTLYESWKR